MFLVNNKKPATPSMEGGLSLREVRINLPAAEANE
jgi:hypothetical protein